MSFLTSWQVLSHFGPKFLVFENRYGQGTGQDSLVFFYPGPDGPFDSTSVQPTNISVPWYSGTAEPSRDLAGFFSRYFGICCPVRLSYRDCPAVFCPVPDFPVALSSGPGPNPRDLWDRYADIVPGQPSIHVLEQLRTLPPFHF